MIPASDGPLVGTVAEFDADAGLGTVELEGVALAFHCTAITDGTREIEPGVTVAVTVVRGRGGVLEAGRVRKLEASGPGPRIMDDPRPSGAVAISVASVPISGSHARVIPGR